MDDDFPISYKLEQALALMEDIHAAGYTLAPLTPTDAMVKAGIGVSNIEAEAIMLIYSAMISAAGDETSGYNRTKQ